MFKGGFGYLAVFPGIIHDFLAGEQFSRPIKKRRTDLSVRSLLGVDNVPLINCLLKVLRARENVAQQRPKQSDSG